MFILRHWKKYFKKLNGAKNINILRTTNIRRLQLVGRKTWNQFFENPLVFRVCILPIFWFSSFGIFNHGFCFEYQKLYPSKKK